MEREVYLDNAATTKPCPEAIAAAANAMERRWGNPSSLHASGMAAVQALETARQQVAGLLRTDPSRLRFTSGGTEANNWALFGTARRRKKGHMIASTLEHPSVLEPLKTLEQEGFPLTLLAPDASGRVPVDAVLNALREDPILVSLCAVAPETGAVHDIAALTRGIKATRPHTVVHTDAVQALGKLPVQPDQWGVDLCSLSAHKIHGLKGAGALWVNGIRLAPLLMGGEQEQGRAGTEPVAALCAFGAAAELAALAWQRDALHMETLKTMALERLQHVPGLQIIAPHDAPHILSFAMPGYPAQVLLNFLSTHGVYVSAGSACSRGKRSLALTSMKLPAQVCDSALRLSVCPHNTRDDIVALTDALQAARETLISR